MKRLAVYFTLLFCIAIFTGFKTGSKPSGSVSPTWTRSRGLEGASISSFVSSGKNLLAGIQGGYVYLSLDSGANWTPLDTLGGVWNCPNCGLELDPDIMLFVDSGKVFASDANTLNGYVKLSTDNGMTWVEQDSSFVENTNCFAMIGGDLFAGTDDGVFLSTDNGTSWTAANNGFPYGNNDSINGHAAQVMRILAHGTTLFAGTTGEGIYRSDNNGGSWIEVDNGLTNLDIYGLASIGTELFAGAFRFAGDSIGGVFVSTDNGASWSPANTGLTNQMINVLYANGTDLFAGTNIGVFASTNRGASWTDISTGTQVDSLGITALAVFDSFLFAGTNSNGVWRYPISQMETQIRNGPGQIPADFVLSQNYPNPCNPSTIISYDLPVNAQVTLKVFDVLGREIQTLVNELQSAGNHSVTFNASNLPSGVYFYRLQAGTFSQTMKLLLLK